MTLATCEYQDCDAPTQEHLCHTCVQDLRDDWEKIPDLLPVLRMIARGEEKAQTLTTQGGGGGLKGGSKPPINLDAFQLAADLERASTITPEELAQMPGAGRRKHIWHTWIDRADKMVNGEEEKERNDEYTRLLVKARGLETPMRPREAIQALAEKGITGLTESTLRTWKDRGKITDYTIKEIYAEWEKRPTRV